MRASEVINLIGPVETRADQAIAEDEGFSVGATFHAVENPGPIEASDEAMSDGGALLGAEAFGQTFAASAPGARVGGLGVGG